MKEKTFYREKAERIKDTILISKETPMGDIIEPSDMIKPYPGLHDSLMEFIHLVYSFDPNLPLNKEIGPLLDKEPAHVYGIDRTEYFSDLLYCVDFFIHYLDEYVD